MEQPHNTLESQKTLKRRGITGTVLILSLFGGWLVYTTRQETVDLPHLDEHHATSPEEHSSVSHETDTISYQRPLDEGEHAESEKEYSHEESPEHDADSSARRVSLTKVIEKSQEEGVSDEHTSHAQGEDHAVVSPDWFSILPFVALLGCIAILPLTHRTEHWWENNLNRFMVAAGLGVITLAYYAFVYGHGVHDHLTHTLSEPGFAAAVTVLKNALLSEYIPFITLLFSLYVVTGGIVIEGRLAGTSRTNASIIGIGAVIASFVGTTGAAMLLIRPLLSANIKRKYIAHTVIFFIFAVCNTGGCLLPIGDPPLFLGFLRGVDFFWTMKLWPAWLFTNLTLVVVYYLYDCYVSRKEARESLVPARTEGPLLSIEGKQNFLWLAGIIFCVATLDPSKPFPGTQWHAPMYLREFLMFLLTLCSLVTTTSLTRLKNTFNYDAIFEVAALFSGIFICMQAPVQILNVYGKQLGFDTSVEFFWGTGFLSSFLDNAPTYVVFFETAKTMDTTGPTMAGVSEMFLVAISLGAVFMGAMTYIGNGPNFMVKAIAEKNNVRMPSFFGYMIYSSLVLLPIFLVMTLLFL